MKYLVPIVVFLFTASATFAQQGYPKYYELIGLWNKADSLFKASDYKASAKLYGDAAQITIEKAFDMDYSELHYNAACAWAMAKKVSKCFAELNLIASKMNYSNFQQLTEDSSFIAIHKDKRWTELCALVKSNAFAKEQQEQYFKSRTTFQGNEPEIIFSPHTSKMREYIDNDSLPFISINYANFRIYFRGNSYAANHLFEVKQEVDSCLKRIFSVLQIAQYNKGLNLVLVDSSGELQELSGMNVHGGFSLQEQDLVFMVNNAERKIAMKHEVFHFIANDIWGYCESRLLNEGGAVFTQNECNDYDNPVYSITAYLLKENKLFPLSSLITNFDNIALNNEVIAYFQSAAVFKYLYEKYGVEKMRQLWVKGFASFESIYEISLMQFEKEWTDYMSTIQTPKHMDWEKLSKNGC